LESGGRRSGSRNPFLSGFARRWVLSQGWEETDPGGWPWEKNVAKHRNGASVLAKGEVAGKALRRCQRAGCDGWSGMLAGWRTTVQAPGGAAPG